jgi:hypothetical protein
MPIVKNVSPRGALDLPTLGIQNWEVGEERELPVDVAKGLLEQPENFEAVVAAKVSTKKGEGE